MRERPYLLSAKKTDRGARRAEISSVAWVLAVTIRRWASL
jgi:hypothetical protein